MKSTIVKDFLTALAREIASAGPANALALARLYANVAWNNPVGIYRADAIEDLLAERIAPVAARVLAQAPAAKNGRLLHVLSEGYTSGGHTRVLERLAGVRVGVPVQDVAIVEICPAAVVAKLTALGASVRRVPATGLDAIPVLAAMMAEYDDVILHIHPDDIVSSLCARIARASGTRVGLYNHADHCFTFGIGSIDVLCELSAYGQKLSRQYRPGVTWSFAGIPLNIGAPLARRDAGHRTVLSSGPAYKFDFRTGGVFAAIVERVIGELGMHMLVIGPGQLPPDAAPALAGLVASGMLVITPHVDYATYLEHLQQCLCYVDSAPITGGSALPEAALCGVPCAGLNNAIMGYSPIDAVRSPTVDALIVRIAQIRDGVAGPVTVAREELIAVHAPDTVVRRLVASVRGEQYFALPYAIDTDALDSDYPHTQWLQTPHIAIHNRAFDFLSLAQRWTVFVLMSRFGVLARLDRMAALKLFVSNIATRRMRNR